MRDLAARVQALEDIAAIKALKYRYLRGCDRKEPETVRDCLDPAGCLIDYEGFPRFENRDDFVAIFQAMGCRPDVFDMHHGQNPQITLTGADRAEGVWDLYFHTIDGAARTVLQMACAYADHYTRHDGRWWITRTATTRTSFLMSQVDGAGAPRVLVMGAAPPVAYGEMPAD